MKELKRTWFIRVIANGYIVGSMRFEGALEEAKKFAEEWASIRKWSVPVVGVWVEIWTDNPRKTANAQLVVEWYQNSFDQSLAEELSI